MRRKNKKARICVNISAFSLSDDTENAMDFLPIGPTYQLASDLGVIARTLFDTLAGPSSE